MSQLYDFNNSEGRSTIQFGWQHASWCGPRTRLLIQAACTVALACLLRFDEVLHLQMSDIEFLLDKHGQRSIVKLMLRSRKTSQFGGTSLHLYTTLSHPMPVGIKPFYLHLLPKHEAHLCPFRALCSWIAASRITTGYLFRSVTKGDRVSRINRPMVTMFFIYILKFDELSSQPLPSRTFLGTICLT